MTRSCLPACLRAPHHMAGTHAMRRDGRASGIRTRTGSRRGMPWRTSETNQTERQRLEAVKAASHACIPLSWILPSGSLGLGAAAGTAGAASAGCRPCHGAGASDRQGKRTSRDGDVCTDAGRRPEGAHSLRLLSRRPAHVKSLESPPHPHPRSRRRLVPVALLASSRRIIADYYSATTTTRQAAKRHAILLRRERETEREREAESPSSPLLHAFCPVASRPQLPSPHFTRSRRAVARPACAKCYRYLYRLASRQLSPGRPARAVVHARGQAPRPISSSPSSV
jgi:hypothetical protein